MKKVSSIFFRGLEASSWKLSEVFTIGKLMKWHAEISAQLPTIQCLPLIIRLLRKLRHILSCVTDERIYADKFNGGGPTLLAGQTEQGSSEPSDAADNEIQFCGLLDEKKKKRGGGL